MKPIQTNLSIYKEFNFENPPVGVKFLLNRPEGIEPLDKSLALCEMIKEAQQRGTPFYIDKDNEDCGGAMMLGMVEPGTYATRGGELGVKWGILQEARLNERLPCRCITLVRGGHVVRLVRETAFQPSFSPLSNTVSTGTSGRDVTKGG